MSEQAEDVQVDEEPVIRDDLITEEETNQESQDESKEETKPEEEPEVVVTIGEAAPPAEEEEQEQSPLVNKLRKLEREREKENRQLKREIKELQDKLQPQEAKIEVGARPKIEDFEWDVDKYDQAVDSWNERKRIADEAVAKTKRKEEESNQAFQQKVNAYREAKAKLKVPDIDEKEQIIMEILSPIQQGILVGASINPALVVAALGSNVAKTKELAAITDHIIFAARIGALERDLKVTPKKSPPPPEGKVGKGSARISGAVDSTLERLRNESVVKGDITDVVRYKRSKQK